MRNLIWLAVLLLVLPATAAPPTPSAREVIVRGGADLGEVLAAATRDAWREKDETRAVAIVIDVTPHTASPRTGIREAIEGLGERITHLSGSWRIAPLGGRLSDAVRHPSALTMKLPQVLATESEQVNTLRALGRTVGQFNDRGGVVLYLADWRFEDEEGLPNLIAMLKNRGQTLRVIGSEACFNRAWNDGIAWPARPGEYEDGIGRSPFGPLEPDAPWHGGDTASPHFPWDFGNLPWEMEFPLGGLGRRNRDGPNSIEDLRERLGETSSGNTMGRRYPLASSWGPWPLMRAAAETGGRYWLWSFNPSGRTDLVYDYGRCNLFEPDLRSRREILADLKRQPVPRALQKAWHLVADPDVAIATRTSPLGKGGAPQEIETVVPRRNLNFVWSDESEFEYFKKAVAERIERTDEAVRLLDQALATLPRTGPGAPRLRADAQLFRHILVCLRFALREAQAVAADVPADAFVDEGTMPGLADEDWILPGRDPENIRFGRVRPRNEGAAEEVRVARQDMLRKYLGTPFGEIAARNAVVTYRYRHFPRLDRKSLGDLGRTPSESGGKPPKTDRPKRPATGGSTGAGPSSGR